MDKTIHIFDLDGTLTFSPTFASFLEIDKNNTVNVDGDYLDYFKKVKGAFWDKLAKNIFFQVVGDFVVIVNADTGNSFDGTIMNYFTENKWKRILQVKYDTIILQPKPGFHSDVNTIGKVVNHKLFDDYNRSINKMILTGRDEALRPQVEDNLKKLNFKYPNYGLYMYPGGIPIKDFKKNVVLQSIRDNGWGEMHCYEDRQDWLSYISKAVKEQHPNVKFIGHLIIDEQDKYTF